MEEGAKTEIILKSYHFILLFKIQIIVIGNILSRKA